jgi:hypothetical protein
MRRFSILAMLLVLNAFRVNATERFVSLTSPNSAPPYTNWDTAAHVIQDAVDAADPGDIVIVTNGVYNTGGRVVRETVTNRVAITKPLTVESVNGPAVTIIEGYQIPGTTNGDSAMRGVWMTTNTTLMGFTVTHGATGTNSDAGTIYDPEAGGILCENFTNSVISNCVIIANSAFGYGGGIVLGTVYNSIIASNTDAYLGGGTVYSSLNRCLILDNYSQVGTGGALGNSGPGGDDGYCTYLNSCTLLGNSSSTGPGGANNQTLENCVLIGNQGGLGGGAVSCKIFNCTIVSNSAPIGAGVRLCRTYNSIVYYNNRPNIDQDRASDFQGATYFTCTPQTPFYGIGNITNEPVFANLSTGDFHLQSNSPCINSGVNAGLTVSNSFFINPSNAYLTFITNDFDGNPRVAGGMVDIGAYEYQSPASKISYAWLQQYNLPPDDSVDNADPDGDGMNNFQEWRAGTDPHDASSFLQLLTPIWNPPNVTLTWQSQTNITYYLQRSADLGASFLTIQSDIAGQTGATSCSDTNSSTSGAFLYRVGVE